MEQQGGGAIVNISSIAGIRWLGYPTSLTVQPKGQSGSSLKALPSSTQKQNIRANSILPGFMNTPMVVKSLVDTYADGDVEKMIEVRNALCPTGKMGDAWDVAYAALFLASDEAKYITGTELVVDGGASCKCV